MRLADVGADLLIRTLPRIVSGELVPVEQDHARASYVPKLSKDDGVTAFDRPVDNSRSVAESGIYGRKFSRKGFFILKKPPGCACHHRTRLRKVETFDAISLGKVLH